MESAQLLAEMKSFESDMDIVEKTIDKLKAKFNNKFIAFKGGKVVLDGCTMDELVERAEKQHVDLGICVVEFISDKETLFIL